MTPTLTSSVASYSATSSLVSTSSGVMTVSDGDVIVVKSLGDVTGCAMGVPTASGQTFTRVATNLTSSHCSGGIHVCTITGNPGTITVTQTFTGSSAWHSSIFEQWTNAQIAGTPATNATKVVTSSPGFTGTLTTVAANSSVTWCAGDWTPITPGTPAYRSSAIQDGFHNKFSANTYVAYYATQDAVAAGSQTFGLTTPTGSTPVWTYLAIEIQQAAGAADPLFTDLMPPQINN